MRNSAPLSQPVEEQLKTIVSSKRLEPPDSVTLETDAQGLQGLEAALTLDLLAQLLRKELRGAPLYSLECKEAPIN